MSGHQRQRFYRNAVAAADGDGFVIRLDGRPVRTPAGHLLRVPVMALAGAIAAEWQAQAEVVRPASMPLTQLAVTAADRVGPQRGAVIDELLKYAQTDLVCYRAEGPADLVGAQHRCWQPLIEWLAERWHAPLRLAVGVIPVVQPPASIAALRIALEHRSALALVAIASIVQATGSLVIGLALTEGRLDAAAAADAALLDEEYQAAWWGRDAEAEARRRRIRDDVEAGARLLALLAATEAEGAQG